MKLVLFAAAAVLAATPALAQTLTLKGLATTATVSAAEFAALPHVRLDIRRGARTLSYEGVSLLDLLHRKVDGPWGDTLTGKDLADVILVTARDGYRVAYSIGEADPGTAKGQVLIADRLDGKPLDARDGPFQVVVESDFRPARSARMVETVQLMKLP
jgi:hypothetical protein